MTEPMTGWSGDRVALLARAAAEDDRGLRPSENGGARMALSEAGAATDADSYMALLDELTAQVALGARKASDGARTAAVAEPGQLQEIMKQRASLELKLQQEAAAKKDLEAEMSRIRDENRQAMESLAFQQQKLRELQEERTRLLADVRRVEDKLRLQINETEQLNLKLSKLQEGRKALGDQAVEHTEQLTALRQENETLRQQMEAVLRERDTTREIAKVEVATAESQTADAVFQTMWSAMVKQWPELFIETHVPTQKTFENLCEAFIELARAMMIIEAHVHQMLRDLRQVTDDNDKLSHFLIILTKKTPNFVETLREYLPSRKKTGNLANLVRALNAWARAFGSGSYKAIVRAPTLIGNELNYNNWPIEKSFTTAKEILQFKYFRDTVAKGAPERVGTDLRKEAGDLAYQDYNDLMKRQK